VRSILEHGLNRENEDHITPPALMHANVRGPGYYD